MKFKPRLEAPSAKDKNYINVAYGGKNSCIIINEKDGSVLPNCVGYAWGRFMEILGRTPTLSCGDAGTWFGYRYDDYQRGRKAQLGAVICWSQYGQPGHVAIVEQINTDGSIVISQSGYNYSRFWTQTIPKDYSLPGYTFQGFIYNPESDSVSTAFDNFMEVVYNSVNMNADEILSKLGSSKNTTWNTRFVGYCVRQAGIPQLLPNVSSATQFVKSAIKNYGATWHKGPHLGDNSYQPNVGDIICLTYKNTKSDDQYYTDRVAIIINVQTQTTSYYSTDLESAKYPRYNIQVVEGDVNGVAQKKIYNQSNSFIVGYIEPNWNRCNTSRSNSIYVRGSLYNEVNDKDDALLREVSYLSGNQPLINMTDIKLSVINYTSALADFFEIVGIPILNNKISDSDGYDSQQYIFNNPMTYAGNDTQALRVNGRIIFEEFVRQGLPASAAVGVMSYMWAESRWDPAAINLWEDQPYKWRGRGLCQWSIGRAEKLVQYVPDWETNVTGQVDYCVQDMKTGYGQLYSYLLSLKNTKADAINAAKKFTLVFGAGQPFDWTIEEGEKAFKNWYGDSNWNPHIEPAEYMWDNNINTILLN